MVRVTIESESQKELTDWALRYLADLGYVVSHSRTLPETPQQLATRLNLSPRHILRRLAHPGCPQVRLLRSKGNRVSLIFATPELEEFLQRKFRN
jgi:hypothetical protein